MESSSDDDGESTEEEVEKFINDPNEPNGLSDVGGDDNDDGEDKDDDGEEVSGGKNLGPKFSAAKSRIPRVTEGAAGSESDGEGESNDDDNEEKEEEGEEGEEEDEDDEEEPKDRSRSGSLEADVSKKALKKSASEKASKKPGRKPLTKDELIAGGKWAEATAEQRDGLPKEWDVIRDKGSKIKIWVSGASAGFSSKTAALDYLEAQTPGSVTPQMRKGITGKTGPKTAKTMDEFLADNNAWVEANNKQRGGLPKGWGVIRNPQRGHYKIWSPAGEKFTSIQVAMAHHKSSLAGDSGGSGRPEDEAQQGKQGKKRKGKDGKEDGGENDDGFGADSDGDRSGFFFHTAQGNVSMPNKSSQKKKRKEK